MHGRNKLFRWLYFPLGAVVLLVAAYAALLGASWVTDRHFVLREEFPAHGDYSRLTTSIPQQTVVLEADPAAATKQLQALVRRAGVEGREISVAGSAHSMGGHTLVNGGWRVEEFPAAANDYAQRFDSLVSNKSAPPALAYGRLSIAPGPWFLREARIIRFNTVPAPADSAPVNTVAENGGSYGLKSTEIALARAVFRASAGSDFGKLVRWTIERWHGQTHRVLSRNGVLQTPSTWFANRDPRFTEILHEYFVPPDQLTAFLDRIRPRLRNRSAQIDLLNVTVRKVRRDDVTDQAYAREDVFSLVFLFRYRTTINADAGMAELTRGLIDDALASHGTYYLPYRPHATVDQFRRAYPGYAKVAALKRACDPHETFQSDFYEKYLRGDNER